MRIEFINNDIESDLDVIYTLHNINVLPNKGDSIYINSQLYIVDSFIWHVDDNKDLLVSVFVDIQIEFI